MLRVKDVAEKLGVSSALVYELTAKGKLPCYRIGLGRGAIRFKEDEVDSYLAGCRMTIAPEPPPEPSRPRLKHIRT